MKFDNKEYNVEIIEIYIDVLAHGFKNQDHLEEHLEELSDEVRKYLKSQGGLKYFFNCFRNVFRTSTRGNIGLWDEIDVDFYDAYLNDEILEYFINTLREVPSKNIDELEAHLDDLSEESKGYIDRRGGIENFFECFHLKFRLHRKGTNVSLRQKSGKGYISYLGNDYGFITDINDDRFNFEDHVYFKFVDANVAELRRKAEVNYEAIPSSKSDVMANWIAVTVNEC